MRRLSQDVGGRLPPERRLTITRRWAMLHLSYRLPSTIAAVVVGAALAAALPASGGRPPAAADASVITEWNAIAVNTIAGPAPNGAGMNNAEGVMWFAFAQAAVYNAVEGITGDYDLYDW